MEKGRRRKVEKEEELRKKVIELEFSKAQLGEIEKQLVALQLRKEELENVKESLEELKGRRGKEMLFSFVPGVFVKGRLEDDENLLVEVGADVVIKKSLEDTKKFLEEKIGEIDRLIQRLSAEHQVLMEKIRKLEPEILELAKG